MRNTQKRKRWFILAVVFILWLGIVNSNSSQTKASYQELLIATAIYFVCCLPTVIYIWRLEKTLPYLPVFGIFYFGYFGLSVFNSYDLFRVAGLTPQTISKCLTLALAGFISLMLPFYTPLGKIMDVAIRPLKINWNSRKAYRLGMLMGLFGNIIYYLSMKTAIPLAAGGVIDFLSSLSRFGIATLFMLQLQGKLSTRAKIMFWALIFMPRFYLDLSTAFLFPIIFDFVLLFFIYFYYRKTIPWLRITVILMMVFALASVKTKFRYLTWYDEQYASATPLEKGILYVKLIYEKFSGGEDKEYQQTYETLSSRSDYLVTFTKVVELTPSYIPFWGGYTYSTLLTSLVPRFMMPDKPSKNLGQEFGHRYRFLDPWDDSTSYNLPMTVEMYINFGEFGIIIGMFILGLILRGLYNFLNSPDAGDGGIVVSAIIFLNLLNIESDFSMVFGNVFQYMILFYIIARRAREGKGRSQAAR
ncbi:MAG: hypothetical protein PHO42_04240 [Candidatus Omnitrophica bacterium]|nr:hypothetical protein [Candidatus Omnitrophota bacterium]